MALQNYPHAHATCPRCDSRLEADTDFGSTLAAIFLTDAVTWILTAIFVGIGLLWTPAYMLAACIAVGGMCWAMSKQQERGFVCRKCGRQFTPDGVER
jgi:hypothetical protein